MAARYDVMRDGRADAANERARGVGVDSRPRARNRPARPDPRAHRSRDAGRSRALPQRRHGRLPDQADQRRRSRSRRSSASAAHRRNRRRQPPLPLRPRRRLVHRREPPVFDEAAALKNTGDRDLLKSVIALFRPDASATLQRIDRAIASRNAEGLRTHAHALKGSAATVGAAGRAPACGGARTDWPCRIGGRREASGRQPAPRDRAARPGPDGGRPHRPHSRGAAPRHPFTSGEAPPRPETLMSRILVVDDDRATRHVLSAGT